MKLHLRRESLPESQVKKKKSRVWMSAINYIFSPPSPSNNSLVYPFSTWAHLHEYYEKIREKRSCPKQKELSWKLKCKNYRWDGWCSYWKYLRKSYPAYEQWTGRKEPKDPYMKNISKNHTSSHFFNWRDWQNSIRSKPSLLLRRWEADSFYILLVEIWMSKIPTEGNLLVSVKITNANTLWLKNTKINSGIYITDILAHVQRGIAAMLFLVYNRTLEPSGKTVD